ncbi:MAG: hypothetical protein ACJ8C4_17545 [Gemmataceae bacterium]
MRSFWQQVRLPVLVVGGTLLAIVVAIGMGYTVYHLAKNSEAIAKYGASAILSILIAVLSAAIYFVPFACAVSNKHRNTASIFVLNLFAGPIGMSFLMPGLTLLIWALTLAYAVSNPAPKVIAVQTQPHSTPPVTQLRPRAAVPAKG